MKTYEEMAESALKRIDEYETVQKKRKKMIVKTACPIISFCFAALLGFGVWQNGWFSTHTGQTETSVTSQAASSDESNSALSSGEPTKPGTSALEGTQNHLFIPWGSSSMVFKPIKMISSNPCNTSGSYTTPGNGHFYLSGSLSGAIEEYGDTVRYRVVAEVFHDSEIVTDKEVFQAEMERLFQLGYISAIEEYNDGTETFVYFMLHATAKQLQNFAANQNFGYFFFLYDEK